MASLDILDFPLGYSGEVQGLCGWLDVWLTPAHALQDGPDADAEPDHVIPNPAAGVFLGGVAPLVSPGSGFASSYAAVTLRTCGEWTNTVDTAEANYLNSPLTATYRDSDNDATNDRVDTGDGCWTIDMDGDGVVDEKKTGASATWNEVDPISRALTDVVTVLTGKRTLVGQWTALSDANVRAHTKVGLTLPQTPLRYEGQKTAGGAKVRGTDPVSILVFDADGGMALDSREVLLAQDVNVCTFLSAGMALEAAGRLPGLACHGRLVGALQGTSGIFRLFNNTAVTLNDAGIVTNDGTEARGLSVKRATAADGSGMGTRPAGGGGGASARRHLPLSPHRLGLLVLQGDGRQGVRPSHAVTGGPSWGGE